MFFPLGLFSDSNQLCDKITKELDSVAVDWKSLRTTTACSCTTPFDQFSRKVNKFSKDMAHSFCAILTTRVSLSLFFSIQSNCWRCGEVYCVRCINHTIELPGHDSNKTAPVCRNCFRVVQQNNSP